MTDIRLSVIIPVYNAESYFQRCLDSLARQQLDGVEVIIINDGSRDRSGEIARAFQARQAPAVTVRVIDQANAGQGAARNRGLALARGRYIYFLDADDFLEPDSLAPLCAAADQDDLDCLLFDRYDIRTADGLTLTDRRPSGRTLSATEPLAGSALFARLIEQGAYSVLVTTLLLRRDLLDRLSLRFCEGINHEDELFMFCLILGSRRARYSPECRYNHLIRPGSVMTGQSTLASFMGNSAVFMGMGDFIARHPVEPVAQAAVRRRRQKTLDIALARYCQLGPAERAAAQPNLRELKAAIRQSIYARKLKYRLFDQAEPLYRCLFKLYHSLRKIR